VMHASERLGLGSGSLVAVPIPEEAEAEAAQVQAAIDQALAEAEANGIRGRDATPFLLARINELTGGASLASNIALIKNNAAAGASIAVALAKLRGGATGEGGVGGVGEGVTGGATGGTTRLAAGADADGVVDGLTAEAGGRSGGVPVVAGGMVADLVVSPSPGAPLLPYTSNPGHLSISPGGVARNIAEGLARLGGQPLLISAVGADAFAEMLLSHASSLAANGAPILLSACAASKVGAFNPNLNPNPGVRRVQGWRLQP